MFAALFALAVVAAPAQLPPNPRHLTVTGDASLTVPATQAVVALQVSDQTTPAAAFVGLVPGPDGSMNALLADFLLTVTSQVTVVFDVQDE